MLDYYILKFVRTDFNLYFATSIKRSIDTVIYTYTYNRFKKCVRVDIKVIEDWLQVNILLLRLSIVAIFG